MKKQRRREEKRMQEFFRDHCFNGYWYRPMKLRKIEYSKADIEQLIEIRAACIEAGRKRMIARGLYQYATKEELLQLTSEQISEYEIRTGSKGIDDLLKRFN